MPLGWQAPPDGAIDQELAACAVGAHRSRTSPCGAALQGERDSIAPSFTKTTWPLSLWQLISRGAGTSTALAGPAPVTSFSAPFQPAQQPVISDSLPCRFAATVPIASEAETMV